MQVAVKAAVLTGRGGADTVKVSFEASPLVTPSAGVKSKGKAAGSAAISSAPAAVPVSGPTVKSLESAVKLVRKAPVTLS